MNDDYEHKLMKAKDLAKENVKMAVALFYLYPIKDISTASLEAAISEGILKSFETMLEFFPEDKVLMYTSVVGYEVFVMELVMQFLSPIVKMCRKGGQYK